LYAVEISSWFIGNKNLIGQRFKNGEVIGRRIKKQPVFAGFYLQFFGQVAHDGLISKANVVIFCLKAFGRELQDINALARGRERNLVSYPDGVFIFM
jgi:hypothetical protein